MAEGDRERTLRFLNGEITRENTQLLSSAQGIDTKAAFVAGVAAAALPFLLGGHRGAPWVVSLVVGLALAVAALWPRRWKGLVPRHLRDRLSGADPVFAIGHVAGTEVVIFETNYAIARRKLLLWIASVVALGGGTLFLVLSTILEDTNDG